MNQYKKEANIKLEELNKQNIEYMNENSNLKSKIEVKFIIFKFKIIKYTFKLYFYYLGHESRNKQFERKY